MGPRALGVDEEGREILIAGDYGLEPRDDLVTTILARMSKCAEDIARGAARGSVRHRRLAKRGDNVMIRAMQEWVAVHEQALRATVQD
jgi:hypothetical protein